MFRFCSSSENPEEEVVVCDDDVLVVITMLWASISCGTFLIADIDKMLLKNYIKNIPTNIIICPPQGIIHRNTQANVYSSVVSRHSKVSDSSSLTSSICRRSGRNPGVRNRSKFQLIFYELVNCGSHNQQLLTLKEELRNPDIRKKNELISSSTSNSLSNTFYHSPRLFDLMKQCNGYQRSTC